MLQPLDACYALEVMNDSHTQQLLPRVEQPHAEWEAFAGHCVDCKVALGTATAVVLMLNAADPGLKLSTATQSCTKGLFGLSPVCCRDPGTSAIHSGCMSCLAQKRQTLSGCLPSMPSSCCAASCSSMFWLGPASCLAFPSASWQQHHSCTSFVAPQALLE